MDVNENDMDTAHRLVSAISDANPAQLTLPEVRAAHTTLIWNAEADFPSWLGTHPMMYGRCCSNRKVRSA